MKMRWNVLRKKIVIYFFAVLVGFFFLAPVAWMVSASLQPESDLLIIPARFIPKHPTGDAYVKLLASQYYENSKSQKDAGVRSYAVPNQAKLYVGAISNSFIVSLCTTVICLIIGSLTAYTITRLKFKGRKLLFFSILGSRMVPALALIIPFFLVANKFGFVDQKPWLIAIYCSFTLPYVIYMLKSFFETIPVDLEDAARIDGCSRVGTIWRIIYPVVLPGLIAAGIFAFMQTWNEFFYALIMTNSSKAFTVPVISGMFASEVDIDYTLMITSGVLTMLPPVIFTFIFQKFIISGLTAGGVKG
jgi:multiple sugar transport system permease protein